MRERVSPRRVPRVGLHLPNFGPGATAGTIQRACELAVEHGLDGVWASDHVVLVEAATSRYPYSRSGRYLVGPDAPWYEALAVLASLVPQSGALELGTSVCVLPLREPVLLAKQLATIDQLSRGRVRLGVGVGWLEEEYRALGVPFAERGNRADATIDLLRACWTGRPDPGGYGPFELPPGVRCEPTPVNGTIPILVGGNSRPALRRVAERGDGWYGAVSPAFGPSPEELASLVLHLETECRRIGRPTEELDVTIRIALLGDALTSSETEAQLIEYVSAGVTRLTADLDWGSPGADRRVADLGRLARTLRDRATEMSA